MDDDDDFGDFNDTENIQNDDFGDFAIPVEQVDAVVQEPSRLFKFEEIKGNEREESRLSTVDLAPELDDLFKKFWPIQREIENDPDSDLQLLQTTGPKELIKLSPEFTTEPWHEIFLKCQNDTIYTEESFRWRKSLIRTAFLESISALAEEKKRSSTVTTQKPKLDIQKIDEESFTQTHESNNSTTDSREQELISAKKLCDIPEEEIRKKSKQEVRDLISRLNTSLSKIQEQANYWLDAKEQLVMESEMHNKMIASLVTYAQQKEKTAKKK